MTGKVIAMFTTDRGFRISIVSDGDGLYDLEVRNMETGNEIFENRLTDIQAINMAANWTVLLQSEDTCGTVEAWQAFSRSKF